MEAPNYISTSELARSMKLSKVRICQLVKQLKASGIDVGTMMGTCRMFSDRDASIVRSMDRRDYTK